MQPSNKTILERSIGRPAMMAFVLLTGIYLTIGQLIPGSCLMTTQNNNSRNIDPEKVTAERLNGYAALFGCIALVGAYATTGQIIPVFV